MSACTTRSSGIYNICIVTIVMTFAHSFFQDSTAQLSRNDFQFKERTSSVLIESVPELLSSQNKKTGRFGKGIWISTDQNRIYPLASAWAYKGRDNPYYKDPEVLEAVMHGGDALIDDMNNEGQWIFRKKDGLEWGMIRMPWVYTRWIRAYDLIKDAMPTDRRKRWEKALWLGFDNIAKNDMNSIHNIPCHYAMGLYIAGKTLGQPRWCEQAQDFMGKVIEEQHPDGYWTEHYGPVINYNKVYVDALGVYYAVSHDSSVLDALRRSAIFHSEFTYPDGSSVETVDERNPYHPGVFAGNVGFTFTPEGRRYLKHQWEKLGGKPSADAAATFLLFGEEGAYTLNSAELEDHTYMTGDNNAFVHHKGPWFLVLSAYTCTPSQNRWIQDRQNHISLYHDRAGLILGGGNTKLQPLWSNFTAGDINLVKHVYGDSLPDFKYHEELHFLADSVKVIKDDLDGISLSYENDTVTFHIGYTDDSTCNIFWNIESKSGLPGAVHFTFLPHIKEKLITDGGKSIDLNLRKGDTWRKQPPSMINLTGSELGKWFGHGTWKVHLLQENAELLFPALPHNPYRKYGEATDSEGRIVLRIPVPEGQSTGSIRIEIEVR